MNTKTSRTPILQSEDWWACFIGWLIMILAAVEVMPKPPKVGKKWDALSDIFPQGSETITTALIFFAVIAVLTLLSGVFLKFDLKKYVPGFFVIFLLAYLSIIVGAHWFMAKWGIS